MIAFKFLGIGAVGLFSGFEWPRPANGEPGPWAGIDGDITACARGVHACRFGPGLLDWIDDELWRIELDDPVDVGGDILIARRGRLVARIGAWDATAAGSFAAACEGRAQRFASPEFVADAAALIMGRRPDTGARPSDLGPPTPGGIAANMGFVIAHAVAAARSSAGGGPSYEECYAAERTWQLDWFARELSVVAPAV